MEPEDFEQEEEPYRADPRHSFNARIRREGQNIFNDSFGTDIDFEEVREEFETIEALEEIASTEVNPPKFPFFTFYIALVLDVLDFFQFTGVSYFIMLFVSSIFTIILFFLMFGKTNTIFKATSRGLFRGKKRKGPKRLGGQRRRKSRAQRGLNKFAVKYLKKYISRRLLAILIVNVIPLINILASNAFFVFLAYRKQSKIAKTYIAIIMAVGKVLDKYDREQRRNWE